MMVAFVARRCGRSTPERAREGSRYTTPRARSATIHRRGRGEQLAVTKGGRGTRGLPLRNPTIPTKPARQAPAGADVFQEAFSNLGTAVVLGIDALRALLTRRPVWIRGGGVPARFL